MLFGDPGYSFEHNMPVNEVIEAAYQLEDKVGIALGPVIVNIVLFHAFMAPSGMPLALFVVLLEAGLAWWTVAPFGIDVPPGASGVKL